MADSRHLREIFDLALELQRDDRPAFLAEACSGDEALRREVERLIVAHERQSTMFDDVDCDETESVAAEHDVAHAIVGPYRIVKQLGQGGMGSVFLAVRNDDQYTKHVAIKVLREGIWSADHVRRFRHERQMLAAIDHPFIAKLLDGGATASGLPYIVMEYVDGQPLDVYCDSRRLSIRDRLELFQKVCSAVHCAHRNLIVHRDLKPQNVLVTVDGTPKLVDFGIAKPLKPELIAVTVDPTHQDARLMTPEYASPEQVNGETVTTGSDVYSLGAVLYELLTGHRPYRLKTRELSEILRAICEQEPTRPSTVVSLTGDRTPDDISQARQTTPERLRRQLKGDLEHIVLMAMRKQPDRRYASAEQLSDDIARYVAGQPVRAQRDTVWYRTSKFVARHRGSVAAGIVVAAGLSAAVIALAMQSMVIRRERDRAIDARARAERETTKARAVSQFLQETLGSANPFTGVGRSVTLLEILDRMSRTPDQVYSGDVEIDAAIRTTIGATYVDVGRYAAAAPLLSTALDARRRLLGPTHPDVADSVSALAYLRRWEGRLAESEALYREALLIVRRAPERDNEREAELLHSIGIVLSSAGNEKGAISLFEEALKLARSAPVAHDRQVGEILTSLGVSHRRLGRLDTAERCYREALPLLERRLGTQHPQIATTLNNLGVTLQSLERYPESAVIHRQALEMRKKTLGEQHPLVANSMVNLAVVMNTTGDFAAAEALDRRALEITRAALGPEHARIGQILVNLGNDLSYQKKYGESEQAHEESLRIRLKLFGLRSREVGESLNNLGWVLKAQHKLGRAEPLLRQSAAINLELFGEASAEVAQARTSVAALLCEKGERSEASTLFEAAVAFFDRNAGKYELPAAITRGQYGECLVRLHRYEEAEKQLTLSYARMAKLGASHRWAQQAAHRLADFYHQTGNAAEEKHYRELALPVASKS